MELHRITSTQNPYVKKVVALRKDGLARQQEGLFLVEGERLVAEALKRGVIPRDVIYVPRMFTEEPALVEDAAGRGARIVSVSKDVYKKLADTQTPVWLAALFPLPAEQLADVLARPSGVFVVASGVQDPGNLGAIWRSAACFSVQALVVATPACDLYNAKSLRAAAGAFFSVPAVKARPADIASALVRHGVPAYGAQMDGDIDVEDLPASRPIAVVMGHETQGIHPDIARVLAGVFRIPQSPEIESMNVAAACAVTLYVLSRKKPAS